MAQREHSTDLDRRAFLARAAGIGAGLTLSPLAWADPAGLGAAKRKEVYYYKKLGDGMIQCLTCPHECLLGDGELGKCRAKRASGGKHYLEAYGQLCVLNRDPIEKGPLYHVRPGARVVSVAMGGCNLQCLYCQNWQFSQKRPGQVARMNLPPTSAAAKVKSRGIQGIAFTYTDPIAFYEYARDTAEQARAVGLLALFCTAGYVRAEPLKALCRPATAFTITFKAFSESAYQELAKVSMRPVLDSMRTIKEEGKWLEVVSLIVPGLNDDPKQVRRWGKWMVKNLGPDTPWHFSRFAPAYEMRSKAPTPTRTLEACRKAALDAGVRYAYVTNVAPHEGNHTYCPRCGKKVVERLGFKVIRNRLRRGRCAYCGARIAGIWG